MSASQSSAPQFREPSDDARYLIQESGRELSYAEMVAGVEDGLRPRDEAEYQALVDTMGAIELG